MGRYLSLLEIRVMTGREERRAAVSEVATFSAANATEAVDKHRSTIGRISRTEQETSNGSSDATFPATTL